MVLYTLHLTLLLLSILILLSLLLLSPLPLLLHLVKKRQKQLRKSLCINFFHGQARGEVQRLPRKEVAGDGLGEGRAARLEELGEGSDVVGESLIRGLGGEGRRKRGGKKTKNLARKKKIKNYASQ
jgi:hypothetical protein